MGYQQSACTNATGSQRGFSASMAAANYDDIESLGSLYHAISAKSFQLDS